MKSHIAFIGLGLMGQPMARNLLAAGFPVTVHNRTRAKAEALVEHGAVVADSPAEAARGTDVVITMLPNTPDVEAVVLGPGGVIETVRPDSVVIDMSTISPDATRGMAARLAEKGVHMLDAPVSGGQVGAEKGTLSIMVGGEEAIFARFREIFAALGKSAVYMGGHGMGQMTKLVNNVICAVTIEAVAEGAVLARKAGIDLGRLLSAIGGGAAASWSLEQKLPKIAAGDYRATFRARLHNKDLLLAMEAARGLRVFLPCTEVVQKMYATLESSPEFDMDNCVLARLLERAAGL
ncbi:NAD(P)-dependent oxidoreductase [bacterium]|nr:NAD(P)-dependent oxidoreductase [bacterium]